MFKYVSWKRRLIYKERERFNVWEKTIILYVHEDIINQDKILEIKFVFFLFAALYYIQALCRLIYIYNQFFFK